MDECFAEEKQDGAPLSKSMSFIYYFLLYLVVIQQLRGVEY